ncbi:MAG: ferric reductase-like transmembrane domain-containing protein [Myxococcota bacterium]
MLAAVRRNKRKTLYLTLYSAVTVGVVLGRAWVFRDAPSPLVAVARGSAAGIYLNLALVLLPMLRFLMSRRAFAMVRVLMPFHKAVEAHVIAGTAVLVFSVVHVLAYAGLVAFHADAVAPLLTVPVTVSGLLLVVLFAALGWGAWMRTSEAFERFYYTHFLTIPIGIACIVHAPWFVVICGAPLVLFLLDRFTRLAFMTSAAVVEHVQLDGRDLDLTVRRPHHFAYEAGDYAFLCVPSISRLEWHPFSLINATSDGGSLSFRIRRYGAWTQALGRVPVGTPIYVDGPFASPCRDLHVFERVVVVAAGIGITPFVSFLEEVRASGVHRFEAMVVYWLERDEASFGRFVGLLEGLEGSLEHHLTVHLVTQQPSDMPSRLIRSERIDWDAELAALAADRFAGATVFFCGPKPLSQVLRQSSRRAGMGFRTESF